MYSIRNIFKHLKTVCTHKYYVAKYCFKFGLYWQGIVHDLSKFLPIEFLTSVKYYQGNRSPIDAEKEDKGYSIAWLHHFHNNKHHWCYWVDWDMKQNLTPYKIPYKYVIEAICDWIGAGITYSKKSNVTFKWDEPYEYYKNHTRINDDISSKIFHPRTRFLFDIILIDLKEKGIEKVIKYHKLGTYQRMYELDDVFNSEMIQVDYTRILNRYYKTKEEREREFDKDIQTMKDLSEAFIGPFVDYFLIKPSFYNYLNSEQFLDFEKENEETKIKFIGIKEVKIEKDLKDNFKPIYIEYKNRKDS